MLKTSIVRLDFIYETSEVSQSILSPFLFNVYMTELDKYIEQLKNIVPHENVDSDKFKQAKKKYNDLIKDFSMFSSIQYVRYANDFLIGIVGTKDTAK
jgi:hypothetical protein